MFYGDFMLVSIIFVTKILGFQRLCPNTSLGKLDPLITSYKVCSKFKPHFSYSLSEGKTQSSNQKMVAAKSAWNYNQYWNVAAVISSEARSPKTVA